MIMTNNSSPRVYSRDSRNHHQITQNGSAANANNCSSSSSGNTPPLVLSLSQIQGGGGLLILNSGNSGNNSGHQSLVNPVSVANFVCNTARGVQKEGRTGHLVLKQEIMDTNSTSSCLHANKQNSKTSQRETKMEVGENLRQSLFNDGSLYGNSSSR